MILNWRDINIIRPFSMHSPFKPHRCIKNMVRTDNGSISLYYGLTCGLAKASPRVHSRDLPGLFAFLPIRECLSTASPLLPRARSKLLRRHPCRRGAEVLRRLQPWGTHCDRRNLGLNEWKKCEALPAGAQALTEVTFMDGNGIVSEYTRRFYDNLV